MKKNLHYSFHVQQLKMTMIPLMKELFFYLVGGYKLPCFLAKETTTRASS
jgi:hypothetical protein